MTWHVLLAPLCPPCFSCWLGFPHSRNAQHSNSTSNKHHHQMTPPRLTTHWQCFASSETGAALANQYHLVGLPAVAVVDPITRAKLWERDGFVPADALVEELVPYMDVGEWVGWAGLGWIGCLR